jgi:hypothetical protein
VQLTSFAPETTGRIGSVSQKLVRSGGPGSWVVDEVPFNALYNSLGQLTSFTAVGTSPVFPWGHSVTPTTALSGISPSSAV